MVNAVHARRHGDPVEVALDNQRQPQIAVMEQRAELERDLIDEIGKDRRSDDDHLYGAKARRKCHLHEVKPERRGNIEVGIDMVDIVKSPQERNAVIGHMPVVEAEIQQKKCGDQLERTAEAREAHQPELRAGG